MSFLLSPFRWAGSVLDSVGRTQQEWVINGRHVAECGPLSEGGFATVVLVRDLSTDQVFAMKKMICQDEERLQAAKREAEVLASLPSHKNIVGFFGYTVTEKGDGDCPHTQVLILLEYCPEGTLLDMLEKHNGILPDKQLLKAMTHVTEAVFCLHSQTPPLLHRDLKLENVLRGEKGVWKIVDFGSCNDQTYDLSEVNAQELRRLSEEVGQNTTMMYRPPEMVDLFLRYPISCGVDIWMLGCILYCLLFHRQPFQEASALAIRDSNFTIPSRSPPPSDKWLDLLFWLLAPDPRHRPTARDLLSALWKWQEEEVLQLPEPVVAHKARVLAGSPKCHGSPKSNGGKEAAPAEPWTASFPEEPKASPAPSAAGSSATGTATAAASGAAESSAVGASKTLDQDQGPGSKFGVKLRSKAKPPAELETGAAAEPPASPREEEHSKFGVVLRPKLKTPAADHEPAAAAEPQNQPASPSTPKEEDEEEQPELGSVATKAAMFGGKAALKKPAAK